VVQGIRGRPPVALNSKSRMRRARGLAAWNRLKIPQLKSLYNPLIASQLTRLGPGVLEELSAVQIAAGELVGRVYAAFECAADRLFDDQVAWFYRAAGITGLNASWRPTRRVTQSPSYTMEYRAQRSYCHNDENLKRIAQRWHRLQLLFTNLSSPEAEKRGRSVIEDLCVNELIIHSSEYPSVRVFLEMVADEFGLAGQRQRPSKSPISITAKRPPRHPRACVTFVDNVEGTP
jgi:hypothetical protein